MIFTDTKVVRLYDPDGVVFLSWLPFYKYSNPSDSAIRSNQKKFGQYLFQKKFMNTCENNELSPGLVFVETKTILMDAATFLMRRGFNPEGTLYL